MNYLLSAIISSAFVSIAMRLSTKYVKNDMTMFLSNYAVCVFLSVWFGLHVNAADAAAGSWFPIGAGIVSGIMYLGSFMLFQMNIKRNGIVLSATFMKLGVIVPTVMAVVVFHETASAAAVAGIVLALIAIIVINQNPESDSRGTSKQIALLLLLLMVGGFTDSLSNIYDKCGIPSLKDLYLLFTFFSAFLCSLVLKICKKQHFTFTDLSWGTLIGVPNYFSARFLLLALSKIQATVVFPVYNIGTIAVVSLAGVVFFREKLSLKKWIAMGLILLALLLLNV